MARTQTFSTPTSNLLADATKAVNKEYIDEWSRFVELCDQQSATRHGDKGVQIFLDSSIKQQLEQMKANGLHYPIRYMLNAAITAFFENNKEQINKYLTEKI